MIIIISKKEPFPRLLLLPQILSIASISSNSGQNRDTHTFILRKYDNNNSTVDLPIPQEIPRNLTRNRLHFASTSEAKTDEKTATEENAYASPYWRSPGAGRERTRSTTNKTTTRYTLKTTRLSGGKRESKKGTRPFSNLFPRTTC